MMYPAYPGYQPFYSPPVPDHLTQLRQMQPVQPPATQPAMPAQAAPGGGILWCSGEEEASRWMVQPGQNVLLMDSTAERFYIRSVDAAGMPMKLRRFSYQELTDGPISPSAAVPAPPADAVTRTEFEALEGKLADLEALLKRLAQTASRRKEGAE